MRIESEDIKELGLFKYYRLVRKWACKTYNLTDAELELLIHFDCLERFTRDDYIKGTYTYSWNKNRWEKLRTEGWIDVHAYRNRTTIKYTVFRVSTKCKHLVKRIYRILLNQEDLPESNRSVFKKNKNYMNKVFIKAVEDMNKDMDR